MNSESDYSYNGGFVPLDSSRAQNASDESDPGSTDETDSAGHADPPDIEDFYYFPRRDRALIEDIYYHPPGRDRYKDMPYYHRRRRAGQATEGADAEGGWVIDAGKSGPGGPAAISDPELVPGAYPDSPHRDASTRPLTVAHVGPFLLRAGAEQWLLDLARSLDPSRLRLVRAIATHGDLVDFEYASQLCDLGVTVEVGGPESVQAAARECDVLLSWGVELDYFLGDVRAPVSVHVVHGDGPGNQWYLDGSASSIDHVVAVSHRVREKVCRDRATTVIYNGVDLGRLVQQRSRRETRARLGFDRGDFVVGYFGRLAEEKRVGEIIDAVALLPERFKLLLAGWGQRYLELRAHAERALPGRHRFVYTSSALGDLYRSVDAVCLASNQEGFPLVMLEAMSFGRPFLTTPVGAALEVIENRVNGVIFDGGAASLASALGNLARYPAWRRGVGRSGRATFEQFGTARRMASDYEHLVHQLWAKKQAA